MTRPETRHRAIVGTAISVLAVALGLAGLVCVSANANTVIVHPPQGLSAAVIASSPGDTILVSPGTYGPECGAQVVHPLTVIGIGGPSINEIQIRGDGCTGSLLRIRPAAGSFTIDGLKMTLWDTLPVPGVDAVAVEGSPTVVIRNCIFYDLYRLGIRLSATNVRVEGNLFFGQQGDLQMVGGSAKITGNTFASSGNAIILEEGAAPEIENNIFAHNFGAGVLCFSGSNPTFRCNDAWNNAGGNYGSCPDPTGTNGNISADPLFCDLSGLDFHLQVGSPCLPENSPPGCGLIGAFGPCELTAADGGSPGARVALAVEPNPILNKGEFSFGAEVASATVEIYDLQGRLVQMLVPKDRRAVWILDPSVPRGVYFARLRGTAVTEVVKFAVIR